MRFILNYRNLVFILPVLLTACGGGSFDTNSVPEYNKLPMPQDQDGNKPSGNEDTDSDESDDTNLDDKAVGYQLDIPRRNIATYHEDGSRTELVNSTVIVDGVNTDTQVYSGVEKHLRLKKNDIKARVGKDFQLTRDDIRNGFKHISLGFENLDENPPVERIGEEFKEHIERRGPTGHLFYQGEQAPKAIPTNPRVTYKGIWHYVTDAKQGRSGSNLGSRDWKSGNEYGAISDYEDVKRPGGLASEFVVDFNNKKLTGQLTKTDRLAPQKTTTRYEIDANIRHNRFNGSAKATNKDDLYFHSDSNSVEGGFYGDTAQELAGSFIANDNSAFVVFGAKTDDELSFGQKMVDAFKINIDDYEDFARSEMESFHDVSKIVIDGKEIPLAKGHTKKEVELTSSDKVEISANRLDYTVFGYFNHTSTDREKQYQAENDKRKQELIDKENERKEQEEQYISFIKEGGISTVEEIKELLVDGSVSKQAIRNLIDEGVLPKKYYETLALNDSDDTHDIAKSNIKPDSELFYTPFGKSLFIQGLRTDEKEMPTSLTVKYEGNWQGSFVEEGISPLTLAADNNAEFTVNFGEKSLTGRLNRKDDINEYIDIEAKIVKNTFSGTARTGEYGIYLDKANTLTGNKKVQFNGAKVEGGFYGPNAAELGGGLYSHEPKAAVVFGAKKVEPAK